MPLNLRLVLGMQASYFVFLQQLNMDIDSVCKKKAFHERSTSASPIFLSVRKTIFYFCTVPHGKTTSEKYKNVFLLNIMYYSTQIYNLSIFRDKDWRLYLITTYIQPRIYITCNTLFTNYNQ